MRLKPVPRAPESLTAVDNVRAAVPLVPNSEADCCARVIARTSVGDRDAARDWLTFLRGLGLVASYERGYARTDRDVDREALAAAFEERVFAAREVCDALRKADGSLTVDDVFERVRDLVPRWERDRDPEWETRWRDRTTRLLDWAVLFGIAERSDGYRAADDGYRAADAAGAGDGTGTESGGDPR